MSRLVSLDNAKLHLKVLSEDQDDDIQMKLDQAEALCLDYVTQRIGSTATDWAATVAAWDEDTVPKVVQAAVLMQLGELHRFRGDDGAATVFPQSMLGEPGFLSHPVIAMLYRLRDPAIA